MGYDLFGDVEAVKIVQLLDVASVITQKTKFQPLNRSIGSSPKVSIEEALKLELKALLSHLKYAFLSKDDTLPRILSAGERRIESIEKKKESTQMANRGYQRNQSYILYE